MRNLITLLLSSLLWIALPAASFASNMHGSLSVAGGMGFSSDRDKSIAQRTMLWGEAGLNIGYSLDWITPIVSGTFRYLGQNTNPSSVGDTNMAGMGYLAGAGVRMMFGKLLLAGTFDLFGTFTLANTTAAGAKVSYSKPLGFHAYLGYEWKPDWFLMASGSLIDYTDRAIGSGTAVSISSDPVNQLLFGLGIGYRL